jgi:hypothetical protein
MRLCSESCRTRRSAITVKAWKDAHRDEQLAYFIAKNAAKKATDPHYFKQYYAAHSDQRKVESQQWYRANAEYALQRQRAYDAAHPDQVRATGRRNAATRRARLADLYVETIDHTLVFARDKGICGICRSPVDPHTPWEVDHIRPISKGGLHAYSNVQLAHRSCNRSKAARLLETDP